MASARDQVEVLKELLRKQGKGYLLEWLQDILLDTCQVKVVHDGGGGGGGQNGVHIENIITDDGVVQEPVPFHFNCKIP